MKLLGIIMQQLQVIMELVGIVKTLVTVNITSPTTDESTDGIIELIVSPSSGFNISWTVGGAPNSA